MSINNIREGDVVTVQDREGRVNSGVVQYVFVDGDDVIIETKNWDYKSYYDGGKILSVKPQVH